jgi:hypothetical protein
MENTSFARQSAQREAAVSSSPTYGAEADGDVNRIVAEPWRPVGPPPSEEGKREGDQTDAAKQGS